MFIDLTNDRYIVNANVLKRKLYNLKNTFCICYLHLFLLLNANYVCKINL